VRIYLLGEAPGESEDRLGVPFVGKSGKLLQKFLIEAGLTQDDLWVSNVIRCHPEGNRNPTRQEVENCSLWTVQQMQYLKPKVVVAVGAVATRFMLGAKQAKVGALRGRMHSGLGQTVIVTWHPAYQMRSGSDDIKAQMIADFRMARKFVDGELRRN